MRNKLLLLLFFLLYYTGTSAQSMNISGDQNVTVNEFKSYISRHKVSSSLSSPSQALDAQNLEELTSKVQSSVYIKNGQLNSYGQKPRNIFTDTSSLNQVDNLVSAKNDIEIIIIKINSIDDLRTKINLAPLNSFKKLKYLYVVSSIDITAQDIAKMITNYNDKYSIFYKIEKGDTNQ